MQSLCSLILVAPLAAIIVGAATINFGWWSLLWFPVALLLGAIVSVTAFHGAKDAGEAYGTMLLAIAYQFAAEAFAVDGDQNADQNAELAPAS